MPELPDLEGFRRVAETAAGQRIAGVRVYDEGVLRDITARTFQRTLTNRRVTTPERYGKWLLIPTAEHADEGRDEGDGRGEGGGEDEPDTGFPMLLLHFGMTGLLLRVSPDEPAHDHDRVALRFDDGELRYRDMRKLQGLRVADRADDRDAVLADLGPDAAAVSNAEFRAQLGRTRRQLKPALMDQGRIAGLGNITVDEILWQARLPPQTTTRDLDEAGWRSLHRTMRSVLRQSSRVGRVPERRSWLTGHRDEQAARCPRCSTRLEATRVGGRTTLWCPRCQPYEG